MSRPTQLVLAHAHHASPARRVVTVVVAAGVFTVLLLNAGPAHAQTVTWDAGVNSTWDTATANWTGSTYANGYDAQFLGAGSGTVTLSGTINPNSVLVNSSNNYDFTNAAITGSGSLTKSGTGTLTLSFDNTYSGGTTVTGGKLLLESGDNTLANNSSLTIDGATSIVRLGPTTSGNNIFGSGPLAIQNGGTLTDDTPNAAVHSINNGLTFTNGGTLTSNGIGSGNYGNYFINSNISVTGNAAATISADNISVVNSRTITVDNVTSDASTDLTISSGIQNWGGGLANASAVTKNGAGTLTLSGTNTYTGTTTVNAGTLEIQNGSAIGDTNAVTVNAGGTFEVDNNETIGRLGGAGNVSLNANLSLSANATDTVSGDISGTGSLIKSGTGTLTLSGDNSAFSGGITMNNAGGNSGGTLSLNSANAAGTGDLTFNHFTRLYNGPSGPSTINNNITTNGWFFWESGSKALEITGDWTNNSQVVWTNSANALTMSGVVSGTVSTGFYGDGIIALTNDNNNFTGNFHATLDSTIQFATIDNSGVNSALGAGTTIRFDGANQNFNGYIENIGAGGSTNRAVTFGGTTANKTAGIANNGTGALDFSGAFTNNASTGATRTLLLGGNYAGENTISSALSDGAGGGKLALTKDGSTTWTLSGTNTYSGTTTVDDGILVFGGDYKSPLVDIAAGAEVELNGAHSYTHNTTFDGGGTLSKTGAGNVEWTSGSATFAMDSGSLIDVREGTFTGGHFNNEVWTDNLSDLNVEAGATFNGFEANIRVDALTGGGSIVTGFDPLPGRTFTFGVDNGSGTFTGTLGDNPDDGGPHAGNYVKIGTGTQTLTGNNTYTGTTEINAGTLLVNGNQSSATGAVSVAASATLGGTGTIGGATTILANGNLEPGLVGGIGTLTFSDDLSLLGTTHMDLGGTTDQVVVDGSLLYGGTLELDVGAGFGPGVYPLFDFSGGDESGNFASIVFDGGSPAFTFDAIGMDVWTYFTPGQKWTFTQSSGELTFSIIPEPSALLLFGMALLSLCLWRPGRRR